MKIFSLFVVLLVVLGAILSTSDAYKKKLKIKHVWKAGKHGKYGHGHGHKLHGYSKRHQHMHHGKGHY